jgi:membrane-bound serine protease (ClpP class)
MSFSEKLLSMLSDPNIAYILLMLGFYGLLFELYSPGLIFPGIIGVISLVLAFYSMQSMPINFAGLALIIFAIILFILELKIVSHGLLTIGGVVSLILGSLMLIKTDSAFDVLTISWGVILVVALLTILFFLFAIGAGLKAQKRKPTTGVEGLINETAEVITDLNPNGLIKIHGEIWNAESSEGTVQKGTKVIIVSVSDLKLMVKKFV